MNRIARSAHLWTVVLAVSLLTLLSSTSVYSQTVLDELDGLEAVNEPAPHLPEENPYTGIRKMYPNAISDQELCDRTLQNFAARHAEIDRALATARAGLSSIDREFVDTCDPSRLRSSERADCLLSFRLKKEMHEREVAVAVETLDRHVRAETIERERCARLPRGPLTRRDASRDRLPHNATEIDAALRAEWLSALCRDIANRPDLQPIGAVRLDAGSREVLRILRTLEPQPTLDSADSSRARR